VEHPAALVVRHPQRDHAGDAQQLQFDNRRSISDRADLRCRESLSRYAIASNRPSSTHFGSKFAESRKLVHDSLMNERQRISSPPNHRYSFTRDSSDTRRVTRDDDVRTTSIIRMNTLRFHMMRLVYTASGQLERRRTGGRLRKCRPFSAKHYALSQAINKPLSFAFEMPPFISLAISVRGATRIPRNGKLYPARNKRSYLCNEHSSRAMK